jgi:hypothetical protein
MGSRVWSQVTDDEVFVKPILRVPDGGGFQQGEDLLQLGGLGFVKVAAQVEFDAGCDADAVPCFPGGGSGGVSPHSHPTDGRRFQSSSSQKQIPGNRVVFAQLLGILSELTAITTSTIFHDTPLLSFDFHQPFPHSQSVRQRFAGTRGCR